MKDSSKLFIQDYRAENAKIYNFIRDFFDNCPRKKVILGLSGGLDSAVCASLYCLALNPTNIHVVLMPSSNSSQESVDDAFNQANILRIPSENIHFKPIEKIAQAFYPDRQYQLDKGNLQIGNTATRIRMAMLFKIADEVGAIVSGTENRTEHLLGYFTIGGDEISIIEPISHLYKTETRELAKGLGVIIPEILNKKPSAELYEGQTDEDELGFTYRNADIVLICRDICDSPSNYGVAESIVAKVIKRKTYTNFKRVRPYHLER